MLIFILEIMCLIMKFNYVYFCSYNDKFFVKKGKKIFNFCDLVCNFVIKCGIFVIFLWINVYFLFYNVNMLWYSV